MLIGGGPVNAAVHRLSCSDDSVDGFRELRLRFLLGLILARSDSLLGLIVALGSLLGRIGCSDQTLLGLAIATRLNANIAAL